MNLKRKPLFGTAVSTLFSTSDFMMLPHPTRLYFYKAVLNDIGHFSPFKNHAGGLKKFERFIVHQEIRLEKLYRRNPVYYINAMNYLWCNSFSMQLYELLNYVTSNCCFSEDSPLGTILVYYRKMIMPLMTFYGLILNMTGTAPRVTKQAPQEKCSESTVQTQKMAKDSSLFKAHAWYIFTGYSLLLLTLLCFSANCLINLLVNGFYDSASQILVEIASHEDERSLAILGRSSDIPMVKHAILVEEWKLPLSFLLFCVVTTTTIWWLWSTSLPIDEKFWYLNINGAELTPEDAIEEVASSSIGLVNYFDVWFWLRDTSIATSGWQDYIYPF